MSPGASTRHAGRCMAGLLAIGLLWLLCFESDHRLPVVTYVNLGIHELGHMLTYAFSDMVTAMAGSIAQVAAPLGLAVYFFVRGDWVAAALCLAWGASSALEVAVYAADAPTEELELIGGGHDWAFILGPDGYAALDRAGPIADAIRDWAWVGLVTAAALCLGAAFRTRPQTGVTAPASAATAVSSPWAASATSGSAPRSASSPK